MIRNMKIKGIWWIFLAAVFWSVQGVLGKSNNWNPISLTAVRAVFAALVIGLCRKSFLPAKGKENWTAAIFVAVTGLLFLAANNLTTAANAIVIQYIMPVFVALISFVMFRSKISVSDMICCVCMLLGVSLCFMNGLSGGRLLGNILALLSALTYAIMYLSARVNGCDVLSYTYQGCLLSILLIFYVLIDENFVFDFANVASAAMMGLLVGLGYVCFSKGFKEKVSPVKAAVVSYIEPVLNPIWVAIFIGEEITLLALVGIIIVLVTAIIYSVKNYLSKDEED